MSDNDFSTNEIIVYINVAYAFTAEFDTVTLAVIDMFIIIVGILGLVYLLYWVQKETRFNKLISSFPGSKGLPFFGNSLEWSIKPGKIVI